MTSPIYHYDFTLSKDDWTHEKVIDTLYPEFVKKYCFQLEEGDSGYVHYQGRISLVKKRRLNEVLKVLKPLIEKIHLSPTSNNGLENNFYVMKGDTRIEGPWKDDDEKIYIPRQVRGLELMPWQQSLVEKSQVWDTRSINIIHDTEGNIGKSTLVTYLGVHKLARQIPYCNDYKDILRIVMDMPTSTTYLIDMPRAINKERLFQMYSAIETIKNGYAYDDRYHFKEKYFDCPNIWVFTNTLPETSMLSIDRWKYWEVKNGELRSVII